MAVARTTPNEKIVGYLRDARTLIMAAEKLHEEFDTPQTSVRDGIYSAIMDINWAWLNFSPGNFEPVDTEKPSR